ncbi:hypothetical protein [Methanobrevibacter sp.]|uniref:DUF308 domain-containing protein n=1 Tax=Methanobrevibacter sp. TaxID=66852 RepID=UPI0025DD9BD0|nr:hypothetical protein [Methanobrevibacter sp.]MBQ2962577.1 hypothetical protein [Methanobrevibacter sp.]
MADSLDIFTGILLTVIGLVLVYGSIIYRLIDLILIIGVLITIFGLYKLLSAFILRLLNSRSFNRNSRRNRLNQRSKNDTLSRVVESAKEVEDLVNSKLDGSSNSKSNSKSRLKTHDGYYSDDLDASSTTLDEFLNNNAAKEPKLKFDEPIDESKQVLKTKPVKEEKPKFKLPTIRKSNKPRKRSYGYLEKDQEESSPDTVYFTPNYEKPMKVTRRPRRKSETINLADAPKRSEEISKALASVGDAETVYDNEVSDESYSLMPKTIDEEIIMPIDEIDLDPQEEPVYNLSQSENTLYNNVIYDESGEEEFITPIYADEGYREEHGITYDDYQEEEIPSGPEDGEDLDYIAPEIAIDVENLPRPTSIASTNPIASKKDVHANLSRPHKKAETRELPKPKAKPEEMPKPKPKAEDIPRPIPKAPQSDLVEDTEIPSVSQLVDSPEETITIDPNDPESLPIPKLLNSYVICEKGILTSQEAFEEVANHSKEEILLEAPTIKDMGDRFLSSLSKTKSRVIIEEFDLEDISYVLLLSSLIKKGVEIKTLDSVDSFNLIGDTSHALLISNSIDQDNFEYGAVYEDEESVESIKELFESSWNLANDLDVNALLENSQS